MTSQVNVRLLYWIFALSGFSGLIYESIWSRYMGLFLGHAAYAQTLVLLIFMGGMAFGAWICSRWSVRWSNLLRGYAVIEGIVGVLALMFHETFTAFLSFFFDSVIPRIDSPWTVATIKWASAAVLILPQSILLGMTFPLMSGGIIRRYPDRPGGTLAMLYFSNSIGGVLGLLTSGFLLIRLVGLPGTIRTAGIINIGLAFLVWHFGKASEEPFAALPAEQGARNEDQRHYWILLLVALLTGTASFIYEIAWIRMLSMVLGSSTHSFELMLSAFILGLAFGGLWIRRSIDRILDPVRFLGIVQILMGVLALSTLVLYGSTFNIMQWFLKVLPITDLGYLLFTFSGHGIAILVMLPTTFCAGMTLPLITYILLGHGIGERSIGLVYSANTIGAIVGVVFAIHFGLPALGLKNLIVSGASTDIALGVLLLSSTLHLSKGWRFRVAASATGIIAIVLTLSWVKLDAYRMASGVFRRAQQRLEFNRGDLVVFHRDGKTATVNAVQSGSQKSIRTIRTNGKIDASINGDLSGPPAIDEGTMVMSGALPLLLNPRAKTAANIGMGSGLTSHVLLSTDLLREVDTVEIETAMVEGARYFRPRNDLVFTDSRSRIYIEDAKTFFSNHGRKYDIIVSEPSNPWVSGVASLFTGEFYNVMSRHLNEGGLLVQWLQIYEIDVPLVASVLKALSPRFFDYHVYAINGGDIVIVARKGGAVPRPDVRVLLDHAKLAGELRRVGISSIQDIEIRKIGSKRLLDPWLTSLTVPANSDFYPILDLNADRTRFLGLNARAIFALRQFPLPVLDMLDDSFNRDGQTAITLDPRLRFTQSAFIASLFRDNLLGHARSNLHASDPNIQAGVRKALNDCIASPSDVNRLKPLFKYAADWATYLQAQELGAVWHRFKNLPCASHLQEQDQMWIELFVAVGRRDATLMGQIAEQLLTQTVSYEETKYLVPLAILANRVQRKHIRVRDLVTRYRENRFSDDWVLLLDILSAGNSPTLALH